MRAMTILLIFLLVPALGEAQMIVETPGGELRVRYESCDKDQNCRMVERTISYQVCDRHHNCQTVDAFETGKDKLWDEEELGRSGTFVFNVPFGQ